MQNFNFKRDEPVYVRATDDEPWRLRFFDKQESGGYYVFSNGYNSDNVPAHFESSKTEQIIAANPNVLAY